MNWLYYLNNIQRKQVNVYKTEKIIDTHSGIPQMAELCKTIAEEMFQFMKIQKNENQSGGLSQRLLDDVLRSIQVEPIHGWFGPYGCLLIGSTPSRKPCGIPTGILTVFVDCLSTWGGA